LGKILRIDVDGGPTYTIPPDNPFVNVPNARDEIWVYGLRNPWRFSFDRLTGDMYLGDVGQDAQEEVNFQPADSPGGENYGWSCYEGLLLYSVGGCRLVFMPFAQTSTGAPIGPTGGEWPYVAPVYAYPQSTGGERLGCIVVTGGYVYRGSDYGDLSGYYVFADFCTGHFYLLQEVAEDEWEAFPQGQLGSSPSAFGEDAASELYVADYTGSIFKIGLAADRSE
jgi:hypothetical protein